MIAVIQMFNGEEVCIAGRARTFDGVVRLVRQVLDASEGWGAKVRGTAEELAEVGAYENKFGWFIEFTTGPKKARRVLTIACEAI